MDQFDFSGKGVLITGGASGIGRATADSAADPVRTGERRYLGALPTEPSPVHQGATAG